MIGFGYNPKGFSIVKHFDDEYNGNSDLGDLFTVESGTWYKKIFHAGVCCDEDEIIHFTRKTFFLNIIVQYINIEKLTV